MTDDNELMLFSEESKDIREEYDLYWDILIVDDDCDVHSATKYALKNTKILSRELTFHDAYSAEEAKKVLSENQHIALIMLDVVMETPNAGLDFIAFVRNELGLNDLRIILRTGEPNQAPEMAVIRDYDINDYQLKSEVTQKSLYVCLTSALRSYEQISTISSSKKALNDILEMGRFLLNCESEIELHDTIFKYVTSDANDVVDAFLVIEKNESLFVTHSSGNYLDKQGLELHVAIDESVVVQVDQCLNSESNIVLDDYCILYLGSSSRGHRCIFISKLEKNNNIFSQDKDLLEIFSRSCIVSGDNIFFINKLKNHAYIDSLTRLPNRNAFKQRLFEVQNSCLDKNYIVAILDIDGFAEINVSLGQGYGDLILTITAGRLRNRFREPCFLARISSNAFAVIGPDTCVSESTIKAPFSNPFEVGGELQILSVTAAIAKLSDISGEGLDAIKDMGIVLKQAKSDSRGNIVQFDRSIVDDARSRLKTLKKLGFAFENNELFLVFQPKLNLIDESVVGMEALLRWRTSKGQYISPVEFIPLAEQSGLIVRLGEWVLRNAMKQLVDLKAMGYDHIHMAVNLSVAQLQHPEMLNMLSRALNEFDIPAGHIELEITESIAMGDMVNTMRILNCIKNMGFKLAMDDFGTGFSSLNYLQKMPIDCLKIDRAFVQTSNTKSGSEIVEMIIHLAKTLGLRVVAEGVEELEQANLLKSLSCDEVQGFYFAKPMPYPELHAWLGNHRLCSVSCD